MVNVIGLMIINQWPASGLWVIGMFVAMELIINCWSAVMIALAAQQAGNTV
jgi:uncharacterized membrane protein HdeD (DUF308 family)